MEFSFGSVQVVPQDAKLEYLPQLLENLDKRITNVLNFYNLSGQKYPLQIDCTLEDLQWDRGMKYYNYYTIGNYLLKNYNRNYVYHLLQDGDFLQSELPKLYSAAKDALESKTEIKES